MACVVVWQLATSPQTETKNIQGFLIKLSGRQMKHKNSATHPALFAGLWHFLSLLEILEHHSVDDLWVMRDELLSASPLLAQLMAQN